MTEIFNAVASYLHDVFVIKFDGWVILGFVAQAFFTMRFVVQWIASERARRSVVPVAFWFPRSVSDPYRALIPQAHGALMLLAWIICNCGWLPRAGIRPLRFGVALASRFGLRRR